MYQTTGDRETIEIRPQAGRQESFLSSPADIVIYGGAAGGGKTWAVLLDPLRDVDVKEFGATIFRRTYADVTKMGGLWDESEKIYPYAGGQGVRGSLVWTFPSGARIEFGHCNHENALSNYDGAQIAELVFDQLEHFSERMFWYLMMRNRSTCGVRPRVRATCNPPDPRDDGAEWLPGFLSWWIAPDGYADLSRSGKIRWMIRYNDAIYWADSPDELRDIDPDSTPQSVTFITATVYDNQELLRKDPSYLARLQSLPYIERLRFLGDRERGGNWKISAEAGKVFNRDWFQVVDAVPHSGVEARGWDLAASVKSIKNDDPDYTAGVKIRKAGGVFYVVDVINERYAAGEVDTLLYATTQSDAMIARPAGIGYRLRWEIEPGSAGLRETARMKRELSRKVPGANGDGVPSTGDKISKSRAFAVAAEAGKVRVLAAPWTDAYLAQLHGFPDRAHDDMVDASAIAFNALENVADEPPPPPKQNPWTNMRGI